MKTKFKSLQVVGKRWFERTNGNTYHSCTVYITDKNNQWQEVGRADFVYGYGSQYLQTAINILSDKGYLKDAKTYESGSMEPLWSYCRDRKIIFIDTVHDVNRKKDL